MNTATHPELTAIQRAARRATSSHINLVDYDPKYMAQTLEIARYMHQGSTYAGMAFNDEKLIRQLAACGTIVPDRYFKLAVHGDEVLGGFYGNIHSTYFSDEMLANDLVWIIKPSARGGGASLMLLADFERWAKEKGAKMVMIGQSTGMDIARTTKLFQHCGYRTVGFNTVKEL